jgi:glycerol uptake facilitator-like aquaporin
MAEFFGTATLVCVVIGSGITGTQLSSDAGVVLLINALATVLALALLIFIFGPVSGAHFNPAVTLSQLLRRSVAAGTAASFVAAQVAGAIVGCVAANAMFDLAAVQTSAHARVTAGTLLGEIIATAGLLFVIETFVQRAQVRLIPIAVAAWIGSAFFFTSSTSFANPAVTVGRMFSDTFAGIAPASVLPFIIAQLVGAALGVALFNLTAPSEET